MGALDDYPSLFEEALTKNQSIVLGVQCEIWYSGRAEAYLPEGDRIIIIKEDNTLIVHQPKGNNPINYMKAESQHSLILTDNNLFLNSRFYPQKEFLDVKIKKVHFFHTHKLEDGKSIQIAGTEKDMSDMIFNNPSIIEKGFKPLSREEHTKVGFVDVFGYDNNNNLVIIECKRYCGDPKAVDQLKRYVEKIKKVRGIDKVRGILACPKITPNAEKMLESEGFSFVSVKPPKFQERFDKSQKNLHHF